MSSKPATSPLRQPNEPSVADDELIDELRASVHKAIHAFCKNVSPVPVDVTFRAAPRDEDDEGEEHVLRFQKKGGQYWIFVDEQPAETVTLRILVRLPEAIRELHRLASQKRDAFRETVAAAANEAKSFILDVQPSEELHQRRATREDKT